MIKCMKLQRTMQKKLVDILLERGALPIIVEEFNKNVVAGSMTANQFFIKVLSLHAPGLSKVAFYKLCKEHSLNNKTDLSILYDGSGKPTGLVKLPVSPESVAASAYKLKKADEEEVLDPSKATSRGIEAALKIGTNTLEAIANDPSQLMMMSVKDRTDLLFKAMRAQDARVNVAINARREVRAHKAFQHAFDEAAYQIGEMIQEDAQPMRQE